MFHMKIKKDESFESFEKRLRTTYRACTSACYPKDDSYLVRCFMRGLDSNYDNVRELLDINALDWFEKPLNQVIQFAMDIKLNKKMTGSWVTISGSGNATGKQGAARPSSTSPTTKESDEDTYLSKRCDLTHPEVTQLIRKYSCPLCRKNNHPIWKCYSIKDVYEIKLIKDKNTNTNNSTNQVQVPSQTTQPPQGTANMVTSLPYTIIDEADRYDGYSSVIGPSVSTTSDNPPSNKEEVENKINTELIKYPHVYFQYKHCVDIANRLFFPHNSKFTDHNNEFGESQIVINSGATCHNKTQVPISGIGAIQININGFILRIHNVYYIPHLAYSLYSVKEHMAYNNCYTYFGNHKAILSFPRFKFTIFNDQDLYVNVRSVGTRSNKIHWDSKDTPTTQAYKVTLSQKLPAYKPNPSKSPHKQITNIDLHHYFGLRKLKNISHFKQVYKPTVTIIDAGDIPLEIGSVSTLYRTTRNILPVE